MRISDWSSDVCSSDLVKATRSNDYYVTITESKKRFEDGVFIKHKIFLYKEDFEKFAEGLSDVVDYIKSHQEVVEKRYEPGFEGNGVGVADNSGSKIGRASCRERVCQYV